MLLFVSVVAFVIIELPPGDYLTYHIMNLEMQGTKVSEDEIVRLKRMYGLDKPLARRYLFWIWQIVRYGDFGRSFSWDKPVSEVIGDRVVLTMVMSICTLIFIWGTAIPIGIYAATHQYSVLDYVLTFLGFIGMSVPGFLLALALMYAAFAYFDISVTGLFSRDYADAPWSWAKVWNLLQRVWLPIVVIGISGTASLIRVMRATLLDELRKQYVTTARAKGVSERRLLFKYPVRIAITPMISTVGWLLPFIVSGSAIVSIVFNLPTTGPVLLRALLNQDMYLAGSFVMILSTLTIVGTLISDILLAALDPRIRYGGMSR